MGLLMDDLIQAAYTGVPVPSRPGFAHWARSAAAVALPKQPRPLPRDLPFGLPVDHALYRNRIADARILEQTIVGPPVAALGGLVDVRRLGVIVAAVGRAICTLDDEPACLLEVERHGREGDSELAGTVGWLTRFVPVVVRGGSACEPASSLRCADEALANAGEVEGRAEVLVNYLGSADQKTDSQLVHALGPSSLGHPRHAVAQRSHLLEIECWLGRTALLVRWTYGGDVHTRSTMERLAAAFEDQLNKLSAIAAANAPVAVIEAGVSLTSSELEKIFSRFAKNEEDE
jgi:non-ribosomal peptide synthase protein (TIGR01720 family)